MLARLFMPPVRTPKYASILKAASTPESRSAASKKAWLSRERAKEAGAGSSAAVMEKSLRGFAQGSVGTLRERIVILDRASGKVLDDVEQELHLTDQFTHEAKPGSGHATADYALDASGNTASDGSLLHMHTHPIDQAFSDGDWRIFMRSTIGEAKVVGPNATYTLTKTPEFNAMPWQKRTPSEISKAWQKYEDEAFNEFVNHPDYQGDKFVNAVMSGINERLAKQFKVTYSMTGQEKVLKAALTPEARSEASRKAWLSRERAKETVPGIDTLPPSPGASPIKEGYVRLYHQTTEENLRSIASTGLTIEHAKGIEGPRAVYASETGFYGAPGTRPTLEFQVPKDKWADPFVLQDVMQGDMVAVHFPWHSKARYLEENPKSLAQALEGKFDNLQGDDVVKAVAYVKRVHGTTKSEGFTSVLKFNKFHDPKNGRFTSKEKAGEKALRSYGFPRYGRFLNTLLMSEEGMSAHYLKRDRKVVADLDALMEPSKEDQTVERITEGYAGKWKEGDVIESKAFTSTSTDKDFMDHTFDAFDRSRRDPYRMKLTIPKGSLVIDADKYPNPDGWGTAPGEVILARGTKYRIDKIVGKNITATVVGSVKKANPYHDERGRFASKDTGVIHDDAGNFKNSLGIERKDMPQIAASDHSDFIGFAKAKGVSMADGEARASDLKPAQRHFNPAQTAQLPESALGKPILVSRDNYVLDGTNRWVRSRQLGRKVAVRRIDLPANAALKLMKSFPKAGSKDVTLLGASVLKANPYRDMKGRYTSEGKAVTTDTLESDLKKQAKWLSEKAKAMGKASLDQMLADDPAQFFMFSKEWRRNHAYKEEGFSSVLKFNPYHDEKGRFASADSAVSGSDDIRDTKEFKEWFGDSVVVNGVRTEEWLRNSMRVGAQSKLSIAKNRVDYWTKNSDKPEAKAELDDALKDREIHQAEVNDWKTRPLTKDAAQQLRDSGKAKVMYHATNADFSEFRPGVAGAIFVAENPWTAGEVVKYTGKNQDGYNIMPVYVKAENPFTAWNEDHSSALIKHLKANMPESEYPDMMDTETWERRPGSAKNLENMVKWGDWEILEHPKAQQYIRKHHDGFYALEHGAKHSTLAVFSPTQLKSAIGNQGTFNPLDPDITKSEGYAHVLKANPYHDEKGRFTFAEKAVHQGQLTMISAGHIASMISKHGSMAFFESDEGKAAIKEMANQYYKHTKNSEAAGMGVSDIASFLKVHGLSGDLAAELEKKLKGSLASKKAWEKIYQKKSLDGLDKDYIELKQAALAATGKDAIKANLKLQKKYDFLRAQFLANGGTEAEWMKASLAAEEKAYGLPTLDTTAPSVEAIEATAKPKAPAIPWEQQIQQAKFDELLTTTKESSLAANTLLGTEYYKLREELGKDHDKVQEAYAEWQKSKDHLTANYAYTKSQIGDLSTKQKQSAEEQIAKIKAALSESGKKMEVAKTMVESAAYAAAYAKLNGTDGGQTGHAKQAMLDSSIQTAKSLGVPEPWIKKVQQKAEDAAQKSYESAEKFKKLLGEGTQGIINYYDENEAGFRSYSKDTAEYAAHRNAMQSSLTTYQRSTIASYTGSGYTGQNKAAAGTLSSPENYAKSVSTMDKAMEGRTLGADMLLRRNAAQKWFWQAMGVPASDMNKLSASELQSFVGRTYTERAFSSTSKRLDFDSYFSTTAQKSGVIRMNIRAKADTRGIDAKNISSHDSEAEVILDRGVTYVIRSIKALPGSTTISGGYKYEVDVDVIGHMDKGQL